MTALHQGSRLLSRLLVAGLLFSFGCSTRPTYAKSEVGDAIREILFADGLPSSVRLLDHTVGVQTSYPDALSQAGGSIGLGPQFQEVIRKSLMAIHRVTLSSDAEIHFYVLLLSDPRVPGAYLTMVRYMDDVRRANANVIDYPEMFARTILELYYAGSSTISLEQYLPRDIQMEEFLSWQLARRIEQGLSEKLAPGGVVTIGRCGGRFQDGEFAFTLDVTPTAGSIDDATLKQVFELSTGIVSGVLESYSFDRFNSVRLIHPVSGRHLVLPKTSVQLFK